MKARFRNSKKLLLVPGLLSLGILPLIFLHALSANIKLKETRSVSVAFMDETPEKEEWIFNINSLPVRTYVPITFTGGKSFDNALLFSIRQSVRNLVRNEDTISGLQIRLNNARYQPLVRIIDICRTEGLKTYAPCGTDFWAMDVKLAIEV